MEKLVNALVKVERSSQSVKALKYARQMITLGWKVAICLHRPGPAGRTRLGVSRHVEDKCPNAHRYALYHESRYLWSVLKPPPPVRIHSQHIISLSQLFLRPSSFAQRRLAAFFCSRSIHLVPPSPVFSQAYFGVCCVVEIDLANCGLDEGPDPPVKARDTAKALDLLKQPVRVPNAMALQIYIAPIAVDVLCDECAAGRTCRQDAKIAAETAPFGEVVGDIEGWRRGSCVFVVDEGDGFSGVGGSGGFNGVGMDDDVTGEEVAMAED